MFKESKSQKDDAECVLHLVETCTDLIQKHGYPDNDTRTASLVNIRFVSYSSMGVANLLYNWSNGDVSIKQVIPQLLGLTQADDSSVRLMGNSLHKTSKLSLILLGQFQVENCISNICSALAVNSNSMGFYNKANALITYLGLSPNRLNILNTGAQIRNSLHSNGVHHGFRGGNYSSNLNGVAYDFRHEQKVSCATFPHIAHALECSVEVLNEVFSSPQLQAYPSSIPDVYATLIGLGR